MGLFCLKGTLVQPKTLKGVSFCDTERLWKVQGKINSWFPIQLRKKWVNFLGAGGSNETSNFIGLFCLEGKLLEPKTFTGVSSCDKEGL